MTTINKSVGDSPAVLREVCDPGAKDDTSSHQSPQLATLVSSAKGTPVDYETLDFVKRFKPTEDYNGLVSE